MDIGTIAPSAMDLKQAQVRQDAVNTYGTFNVANSKKPQADDDTTKQMANLQVGTSVPSRLDVLA